MDNFNYKVKFIYKREPKYSLYFCEDIDYILNENKKILYFNSETELEEYCIKNNIKMDVYENEDNSFYDIDKIKELLSKDDLEIDCNLILDFWNITIDIAKTMDIPFYGTDEETLYINEKLFHGTNMPVLEHKEPYIPTWDNEEIKIIKKVLKECHDIFVKSYGK